MGPAPFLIAGILNVTPDSFYDGGRYNSRDSAVDQGMKLVRDGAQILDVGGESTRPYSDPVSCEEELERVVPVIRALADFDWQDEGFQRDDHMVSVDIGTPVLSVDTYKALVAEKALEAGALIVNDVSACRFEPELIDVLVDHQPGYVLMHSLGRPENMQDDPEYDDVVTEVFSFFEEKMNMLIRAGLKESRIVLDPGIGFGKKLEHNLELLKYIERFNDFSRPIYMGLSNKSLWGGLLGLEPEERGVATQVATALMAAKGVAVHRVHDVAHARQSLIIAGELS